MTYLCGGFRGAGKFFWFGFIIFLTLNLMCFYGVMGVYITPDLIVGTVLSAFFYGFWCAHPAACSSASSVTPEKRPRYLRQTQNIVTLYVDLSGPAAT